MVFSLVYASRSVVAPDEADAAAEDIVRISRTRNLAADVTGCLIFAAGRFAQVLEGEQAAVEEIMASIARDPRHADIVILKQGDQPRRRFEGWSLAYAGHSYFIERTIAGPAAEALNGSTRGVADLLTVMSELRAKQYPAIA